LGYWVFGDTHHYWAVLVPGDTLIGSYVQ